MRQMTRKQFIQTVTGGTATAVVSTFSTVAGVSKSGVKLGVTLYSYTGEYGVTTFLEDCIADAAAIGAEGIELLSETHIPNYPHPSNRWFEHWNGLIDKYGTKPSYNGYISSEYEGPRNVMLASNHLARQHAKLRQALDQA